MPIGALSKKLLSTGIKTGAKVATKPGSKEELLKRLAEYEKSLVKFKKPYADLTEIERLEYSSYKRLVDKTKQRLKQLEQPETKKLPAFLDFQAGPAEPVGPDLKDIPPSLQEQAY